jgi:plastocyanin
MFRGHIAVAAAFLALGASGCGGSSQTAEPTTTEAGGVAAATTTLAAQGLAGSVGPGFTIALERKGKAVKSLPAGTYRLTVTDRSDEHNFALVHPGGATTVVTGVGFTGTKTITVRLANGRYTFVCQPHASLMRGSFTVGAGAAAAARTNAITTTDDKGGHGEDEPGDDHGGDD